MQIKVAFLFTFIFLNLNSFCQTNIEYTIVKFDSLRRDAGEIPQGPSHDFEFKFKNIGKTPVIIRVVKSSCGCLVPYWSKEPIMPGETGIIKGKYDTKNRPGYFHKTMTVISNAELKGSPRDNIVLVMKGRVIPSPKKKESIQNNSLIKD